MTTPKFRTRIKICGMTDVAEVAHAVSLGVDAIGVILHADSPRTISIAQASLLRQSIPAFVSMVGVFVDADRTYIERAIRLAGLDIVQLHGNESDSFALTLSRPYIKAIRAKSREQVSIDCQAFPNARGLLIDPYVKGQHGGTGLSLESKLWPQNTGTIPIILAGGLSADNVADRVSEFSPFAVDLNSGLEIGPGHKDPKMVARAVHEVLLTDSKSGTLK